MKGERIDVGSPRAQAIVQSTKKPGIGISLGDYPGLVYGPTLGPGVRTSLNQIPVSDIAIKASEMSDIDELAAFFKITPSHVRDALRYVEAVYKPVDKPTE